MVVMVNSTVSAPSPSSITNHRRACLPITGSQRPSSRVALRPLSDALIGHDPTAYSYAARVDAAGAPCAPRQLEVQLARVGAVATVETPSEGNMYSSASFTIDTQMCGETEDQFVERLFVGLSSTAPTSSMAPPTVDGGVDAVVPDAVVRVDDVDAKPNNVVVGGADGAAELTSFPGAAMGGGREELPVRAEATPSWHPRRAARLPEGEP
eukprot:1191224-Prorocentrum_minimum.AAC.2